MNKTLSCFICLMLFLSVLLSIYNTNAESAIGEISIRGYDATRLNESILNVILSSDKQIDMQEISFAIGTQKLKVVSKQRLDSTHQRYILIIDESRPYYLNREGHSKVVIELAKQFICATGLNAKYKLIWTGSKIETSDFINADEALIQIDERLKILTMNYREGNGVVSINSAFREAINSITDTKRAYSIFIISDFADTIYDMTLDLSTIGVPVYSLALLNSASDKQSSNGERSQAISGRKSIKEIASKTHGEYSEWDIYKAPRGEEFRSASLGNISQKLLSVLSNTEDYCIEIPKNAIPTIIGSKNKSLIVGYSENSVSSILLSEADFSLLPMDKVGEDQTEAADTSQSFVFVTGARETKEGSDTTLSNAQTTNLKFVTLNTGHFTISVPATWIHQRDDSFGTDYYDEIDGKRGRLVVEQNNSMIQYSNLTGMGVDSLLETFAKISFGYNIENIQHISINGLNSVTFRYASTETDFFNVAIVFHKGYLLSVVYLDDDYDSEESLKTAQQFISTIKIAEDSEGTATENPSGEMPFDASLIDLETDSVTDTQETKEMVTVKESGYALDQGYYYYAVILHNNLADMAIKFPQIQITARDHEGNLISVESQVLKVIYPNQDLVWAGLGGSIDEIPESIDIEFVEPTDDWHIVKPSFLTHSEYLPLEIKSARIKQDKMFKSIIGEIYNPNSYDLSTVAVTVVFRDEHGKLLAGDTGYINNLRAGKTVAFEIGISRELVTDSFEVYGQPW